MPPAKAPSYLMFASRPQAESPKSPSVLDHIWRITTLNYIVKLAVLGEGERLQASASSHRRICEIYLAILRGEFEIVSEDV